MTVVLAYAVTVLYGYVLHEIMLYCWVKNNFAFDKPLPYIFFSFQEQPRATHILLKGDLLTCVD